MLQVEAGNTNMNNLLLFGNIRCIRQSDGEKNISRRYCNL